MPRACICSSCFSSLCSSSELYVEEEEEDTIALVRHSKDVDADESNDSEN